MKRAIFAMLALLVVASSTGCCCFDRVLCRPWGCRGGCGGCCDSGCDSGGCDSGGYAGGDYDGGGGGCSSCGMAHHGAAGAGQYAHTRNDGGMRQYDPGPRSPQVAYPYYTTRGPRDFLARNPQSIGP